MAVSVTYNFRVRNTDLLMSKETLAKKLGSGEWQLSKETKFLVVFENKKADVRLFVNKYPLGGKWVG